MSTAVFESIGHVESPFAEPEDVPRPAADQVQASGTVVIDENYEPGLLGLDGFSHVVLVSHLHESTDVRLQVHPPGLGQTLGIFATSGPARPNPIGLSIVGLDSISGCELAVSNLDLIDGTPILDIKPFAPKVRDFSELQTGWMADYDD